MISPSKRRYSRSGQGGIALLLVVTAIAMLTVVLLEFSKTTRTHLQAGVNLREEMRASTMAETALVLTRACLDDKAWASMSSMMKNMDLEQLCRIMLNLFVKARFDLPIGGLSIELPEVEGIGLMRGEVDIHLKSEDAFIGLAGLHCAGRGSRAVNCPSRKNAARQIKAILCDPRIAHVFEKEQSDGKEYTREEIIGNLVDWIDSDDNRIAYDPVTNQFAEGAGEGEDAYYRDLLSDVRYRSKDAPFDSVEELRLIRGINDELYEHLKNKVSAHGTGKVDVNFASGEVLASLLRAESPWFQAAENQGDTCGQDSLTLQQGETALNVYVDMIVKARNLKRMPAPLSKPFRGKGGVNSFLTVVRDPMAQAASLTQRLKGNLEVVDLNMLLGSMYGISEAEYQALQEEFGRYAENLRDSVTTDSNLLRVQAQGTSGNVSRRIFSVLKRDGKTVRTLYYREG